MKLQVSIIDGKLIPERYPSAMALTDSEKRIFGILGSGPDLTGEAGDNL
jgi:hypothetical protein